MKRLFPAFFVLLAVASAQPYEHVVVTTDSFVTHVAPLCEWLETNTGMRDTVVLVEDVCASFPGRDDPERLRNFIIHAYQNWSTTHVLLGGDVEVVPVRRAWVDAEHVHPLLKDSIPADLYFADLDGDWDADGDNRFGEPEDSCDLYPDLFVSRLPATTVASVDLLVNKLLVYLGNPEADYLHEVLLTGFDIFEGVYCETTMELYDSAYVPVTMKPCNKEYDSEPGRHMADVITYLNQGQHIWIHADHCNYFGMGMGYMNHGEVMYRDQLAQLTNSGEYTIMTSLGCCTGEFDTSDCASEEFMLAPNGGGIAVASNSRYGLGSAGNPQRGGSFVLVEGFVRGMFMDPDTGSVGTGIVTAWADAVPLAHVDLAYRWCLFCWNRLGEAAMPVWIPEQSGVAESGGMRAGARLPNIVRNSLVVPQTPMTTSQCPIALLDASGRRVMELVPGPNDVRALSPGVYFAVTDNEAGTAKVMIVR